MRQAIGKTVAAGKESLLRAMDLGCCAGVTEAKAIYTKVYESEDAQEGPRAFAESAQENVARPPLLASVWIITGRAERES